MVSTTDSEARANISIFAQLANRGLRSAVSEFARVRAAHDSSSPDAAFEAILTRLDEAVASSMESGEHVDEVNG